jgi:hypothetical protein
MMGIGLVIFPQILVKGVAGAEVNPTIIGMFRGSGGAIIPYSMLYLLTLQKPISRKWGLSIIALANVIAIILDISSVLLDEYKLSYAMIDLPVEIASLIGILIIGTMIRKGFYKEIDQHPANVHS